MFSPGEIAQTPDLSDSEVKSLVQRLYGLNVAGKVTKFATVDDKNYHVTDVTSCGNNPFLTELNPGGYVLKIHNPIDSSVPGLSEGQAQLCRHLFEKKLPVPNIAPQIDGKLCSWQDVKEGISLPVRMYTFKQGIMPKNNPDVYTSHFLFDIGAITAKFQIAAQDFKHPVYEDYIPFFSMINAETLLEFAHVLDNEKKQTVKEIVQIFKKNFMEKISNFTQGFIHADINEMNVLVTKGEENNFEISGLLDFGDVHRAPVLFDTAASILYFILARSPLSLDNGAHVLAGYLSLCKLNATEISCIRLCSLVRLAQLQTFGIYYSKHKPAEEIEFMLEGQEKGWKLLEMLFEIDDHTLLKNWGAILKQEYGISLER